MSEANEATARRWLEVIAGRRLERDEFVTRVDEVWDPQCDWYPVKRWAESAPCHGRDEVLAFLERFWEAWDSWEVSIAAVEPADGDRLLVTSHVTARGRASGVALDGDLFHVFWLRHGLLLRGEDHLTESGARRALGL